MTTPLRLAYVTGAFPFPLRNGYLRHHHLLRQLSERFDLHLFALTAHPPTDGDRREMAAFVPAITTFHRTEDRRDRVRRLLDPTHPTTAGRDLAAAVSQAITDGRVDAVVLSGKETLSVVAAVDGRVPLIVDLCDATSARMTQDLALAGPVRKRLLSTRRDGLRRVERRLVTAGDALLVISERDRDLLAAEGAPARVHTAAVIPNGIDVDYWQRRQSNLGHDVTFCGNLGYRPNADAALHLVHDIMPVVWDRCPNTPVTIIGTGASAELQHQLTHPAVTITGTVPDVRPHLEHAAVFVAPLRIAVGVQNKILEALAFGIPVVTTAVAAAGLVTAGEEPPVTTCDGVAATAAAIVEQLDRRARGHDHADDVGRAWVAERFRWDRSGARLGDLIEAAHRREGISC